MSISVTLRKISNLPGESDRRVLLSFREFTQKTRVLHSESVAVFNETFRWPHYGKVIRDEVLSVRVYNCSKLFSNRLLGKLVVSLQHVVTAGKMLLREPLTDSNYGLTDIFIELDVRYHPVQGSAGIWEGRDFLKIEEEEPSLVIRNDAFEEVVSPNVSDKMDRQVRQLGRSLLKSGDDDEEDDDDDDFDDDMTDLEASNIILTPLLSRNRPISRSVAVAAPRVQSFQINVDILEAQRLTGVNINPFVVIQARDQKRKTNTQKSTNCPFFNEIFQFEFQETTHILFDEVVEIKVFHRRLAFLVRFIGSFKVDISTVYNQRDHRFYQKWAPLTDPGDTRSGVKGYVKASLCVVVKGEPMSMPTLTPPTSSGACEDIEKNLLLPRGMPSERPWARFRIRIYRAEGLPTMEGGLMAKMSKATDRTVFIDPYVKVSFAGQKGETSVASATSFPVWNEEISFIEQFPPLAQRIKVQLLDDAKMGDIALATHFLDLQQISDPTRNGFNPTFGPSWVNLYGSPQNSTLGDVHQALNQGIGDGIFYRGRILLGLRVDLYSSASAVSADTAYMALRKMSGALGKLASRRKSKSKEKNDASQGSEEGDAEMEVPEAVTVQVEEVHPLPEGFLGERDDFLLFASIFEVTMIDPSVGTKPLRFELSIGNFGKVMEVKSKKTHSRDELRRSREDLNDEEQGLLESEDELDREEQPDPETNKSSVSEPQRPEPTEYDKSFSCIRLDPPSGKEKLCLSVWAQFEDHSFRLYRANWLSKMADRLEIGLDDVERLLRRPKSLAKERLEEVLLELVASCKQFTVLADRKTQSRPNQLDKCRKEFIKKNLLMVARQAIRAKRKLNKRVIGQRLTDSRRILKKVRLLAKEPQSTFPDAFLWLLRGSKRLAYIRIPAHSILFSLVEEQRGRDCGKLGTFFMKSPGGPSAEIFAKLEVYLWLGPAKYCKEAITSLPEEFLPIYEEEEEEDQRPLPPGRRKMPVRLSCQDSRYFQLRCHLYQARGLLAADDDGLSDPYAKVLFANQCQVTQVIMDSLSPAWSECLFFDRVLLEGTREDIQQDPPLIVINLYDYNSMGGPKTLGRAFAEPEFKLVEQRYRKPHLQFFDINRGKTVAGELLAAFELIEFDYSSFGEPRLPSSVDPQELSPLPDQKRLIIPDGIRPVLRTFRIEVLFWGFRDLKRVQLFEVERPMVRLECAGRQLESEEIDSYKSFPNFKEMVSYMDVDLPEQAYLHPPLTLSVVERRAFGRLVLVGTHTVPSLMAFAAPGGEEPEEDDEDNTQQGARRSTLRKMSSLDVVKNLGLQGLSIKRSTIPFNPIKLLNSPLNKLRGLADELEEEPPEEEELDWWSKYYASVEELEKQAAEELKMQESQDADEADLSLANIDNDDEEVPVVQKEPPKRKNVATLTLYGADLESEFTQFQDWLHVFPLCKGCIGDDDDDDDDDDRQMGKYKGSFLIYPIEPGEEDNKCQIDSGIPKNSAMKVMVRVYVVKATTLSPADANGKADPYLVLQVGEQRLDTKDRYIVKQLNPVFGEVFEFTVSFPTETDLTITVMDHDLIGIDDAIGETRIDLENRFFSRHRACCGLSLYYDIDGYNKWRDAKNPSAILSELCRQNKIPPPEYRRNEVKVLNKIFKIPPDAVPEVLLKKNKHTPEEKIELEEHSALSVLHRWGEMREFVPGAIPLVPEHVEVRSLWNPDKPGLPQGYLHMWIDMFPMDVPAPPAVDIKPRKPEQYEMRVIIWNTDDVVLDDVNPFTGDPSSDIYVKGWVKGLEGEKQETDVHFNSMTGEGLFNWRFVFRFDYLPTEKEVVYKKKESFFSLEASEFRQPAIFVLQIWDYDRILANDFLGSIEMRLNDMVRGAKTAAKCTIQMAKDRAGPRFSIFRSKKMKGWWPVVREKTQADFEREEKERQEAKKKGGKKRKDKRGNMKKEDLEYTDSLGRTYLLMGKVEAEFKLVTLEEAEANPVGRGRKEPEPLEKPNRPSITFNWFVNPLKTLIFHIWAKFKKFIVALVVLVVVSLFLGVLIYTVPQQISALIFNG